MKEIATNVFQLSLLPRNSINCYVVDDILIDAGIRSSAAKILKAIRTKTINTHVLTHAHADHQGSSNAICIARNIPLWTSETEKANAESGRVIYEYPDATHVVARFQQKYWAGKGMPVSKTLKEGDPVGSFTVIETPGHSNGHLSFFREKDRLLIAGDALINMNLLTTITGLSLPPSLFTTNRETAIQSVLKIYALKPNIICFGHGPVLYNNGQLEKLVEKLSEIS
ncbi:MBL fold metallo-hydrolase [Lacibacter luteus]|uniref:MBL fold metallo-hydrolase n=1 Tax=Lacibacter luteus TaxID=2508719 RepID=A0A4Q1CEV6_9BACT|nr:MBL fold metallo-hydrolase [Lacibacter luteus]RXK58414.1 MBL fold metallo-hydrolase [Lacibacter luteus]